MSASAHAASSRLARTINLGYALDAPREGDWGLVLEERHFSLCKAAGFTAVRLPVRWAAHAADTAPYALDQRILDRVGWAVGQAAEQDLAIVVDNHLDPELMADPPAYRDRFLGICDQVTRRLRDAGGSVFVELLAEPHEQLDAVWNSYLGDALETARHADPARTLIVGTAHYNSMARLTDLLLPGADRNLIVSVHQYRPAPFTLQGEEWMPHGDPMGWLGTRWAGSRRERAELGRVFAAAAQWAQDQDRPIFLGEFGAGNRADLPSRVRWTRYNRELAELHGFSWGFWSFGPGFALYDLAQGSWNAELLGALMT
jgi:endoglucanase